MKDRREYLKAYYQKHRAKILAYSKEWHANNPDRAKINRKRFKENNPNYFNEYQKQWIKDNPDKYKDITKRCYDNNRDAILKQQREYRLTPKGNSNLKNSQLKLKFDITIDDYNQMLKKQGECCAGCKRHKSEFKRALAVDHNHDTGKIRGLLCYKCNSAIGYLKEDVATLDRLKEYLLKYNS